MASKYLLHKPKSYSADLVFWKSLEGLTIEDMVFLITIRRERLKHTHTYKEFMHIRRQISILQDSIRITKMQNM